MSSDDNGVRIHGGQVGVIGIGLIHAFTLTAIVYAMGYKSGARVNPAVTIGLLGIYCIQTGSS